MSDHNMMNTTTTDPHAGHHNHHTTTIDPHAGHNHDTTTMDHSGHGSSFHQMMMVMHAGFKEIIVFPGWKTDTLGELVVSCIGLALIAILYEGLKLFRDRVTAKRLLGRRKGKIDIQDTKNSLDMHQPGYFDKMLSIEHIIQTILHVTQFSISYFLMLAFMTYNYWLCLSILIGIGIGFFVFGVRRHKIDLNEDCH